MEAALKSVFHVHRTVVRGVRAQLHQAEQERDELRRKLNKQYDHLEKHVSMLKEEMAILCSIVKNQKCQAACGCHGSNGISVSAHPSSPSDSNARQEMSRSLEQQMNILAQALSVLSQHLEETRQDENGLPESTENGELAQEPSQTQDTLRKNSQPSSQMGNGKDEQSQKYDADSQAAGQNHNAELRVTKQKHSADSQAQTEKHNPDSQAARQKDNTDLHSSAQNGNGKLEKAGKYYSENIATEDVSLLTRSDDLTKNGCTKNSRQLSGQSCGRYPLRQKTKVGHAENQSLHAKAPNIQKLNDNVALALSRHEKCVADVENRTSFSRKSPEEGTKLQLMRNAVKRRRYTEDESIKKRRRLCSKNGGADHKQDRSQCDVDLNLHMSEEEPHSNQVAISTVKPNLPVNRHSDKSVKSAGLETSAANENKPADKKDDISHGTDHPSSRFVQNRKKETERGGNNEAVCLVPDTLEVDLFSSDEEVETLQKPASSGFVSEPENANKHGHLQSEKQTMVGLSLRSRSHCSTKKKSLDTNPPEPMKSSQQDDRASQEEGEDAIHQIKTKEEINNEKRTSQGAWPTDSVVFGSTRSMMVSHSVHETGGSSSVSIDEGHANTEYNSPIFLTYNKPACGDRSPILFDEEGSDAGEDNDCIISPRKTDNEEHISCQTMLKRPTIHRKVKQSLPVQDAGTVLVSPESPLLLKPSWTLPRHAADHNSSSQTLSKPQTSVSTIPGQQAGSGDATQSHTLQAADDLTAAPVNFTVPRSPAAPKNMSDQGASQAWSHVSRKNLFKCKLAPAPPSADDTVDPALLESDAGDAEDHKTMRNSEKSEKWNQPALCSQLNASLDPAVRLTQYLNEPSLGEDDQNPESEEDDIGDVTLDPKFLRAHQTSGQDVTLISQSSSDFQGASQPATAIMLTQTDKQTRADVTLLDDSFDRVPQKKKQQPYVFSEVVRKQNERKKLKAFSCQECEQYYGAIGLSDAEVKERMGLCSRHRARQAPPSTPEHFWSVGFPDTQE